MGTHVLQIRCDELGFGKLILDGKEIEATGFEISCHVGDLIEAKITIVAKLELDAKCHVILQEETAPLPEPDGQNIKCPKCGWNRRLKT